jgi:DNA-binding MarR family transcriptional regulator
LRGRALPRAGAAGFQAADHQADAEAELLARIAPLHPTLIVRCAAEPAGKDRADLLDLAGSKYCSLQCFFMGPGSRAAQDGAELAPDTLETLQAATRVLAGVALRSVDVLGGAVTLPQFRMLAVLADLGRARSVQVARALGLEASTVTRLADRMVAADYVSRGGEPGHRGVVTLELTVSGQDLVDQVAAWREQELARIFRQLPPAGQVQVTRALRQLVEAAGEGYGTISRGLVPV